MGIMRTKNQGVLKNNSKPDINDGHYPELLDRVWVTMENINMNPKYLKRMRDMRFFIRKYSSSNLIKPNMDVVFFLP